MIPEPTFEPGRAPEAVLQKAVSDAIVATARERDIPIVMVKGSALDLTVFSGREQSPRARMLEFKAYVGQRPGGVPFGNLSGAGAQVDLLWDALNERPRVLGELELLDTFIRWVLGHGLKPIGTPRYALFTCSVAQASAMNGARPGKHNNLRVSAFEGMLITWSELIDRVTGFLFA